MLVAAGAVWADNALQGTVTLKGGKTLTGEIKYAQVGVMPGSGVGTLLYPNDGSFSVKVGDKVVAVAAADLAVAEVQWGLASDADPQSWEIEQITLTKRDGTVITGTPTWVVQASLVKVDTQPPVSAFPKTGADFSPDNLLSKVEIAGAAPAAVAPAATTPAETTPAPVTPAATIPPATAPAETTPAAPAAVVQVPVTPPPGSTSPLAPAATAPPVAANVTSVVPTGQGSFDIYFTTKDGERMVVHVTVNVAPAPTQ